MNISRKIQHFILWVMLTVVGVAYNGKALHTSTCFYSLSTVTMQSLSVLLC